MEASSGILTSIKAAEDKGRKDIAALDFPSAKLAAVPPTNVQSSYEILGKQRQDLATLKITEEEIEEQRRQILTEMNMSWHRPLDAGAEETKTLLKSLEMEVDKMQRQSAASKARRSTAQRSSQAEPRPKDPTASCGSRVIYASVVPPPAKPQAEDLQAIKGLAGREEIADFDCLEKLRAQHAVKLRILEEEYLKKKSEEKGEVEVTKRIADKYGFRKSTMISKDAVYYPTYGRGKDPDPDIKSYMYNTKLIGPNKSMSPVRSTELAQRKREKSVELDKLEIAAIAGKKPKVMSPERQQYESKFRHYLEVRSQQAPSEESRKWVKYESPKKDSMQQRPKFPDHLMGFVQERPRTASMGTVGKPTTKLGAGDTLLDLKPKQKKAFVALRDFYNGLDKECKNSVGIKEIFDALEFNDQIKSMYLITSTLELAEELRDLQKEDSLTWQEFLDLIFRHKESVKALLHEGDEEVEDGTVAGVEQVPETKVEPEKVVEKAPEKVAEKKSENKVTAEQGDFPITVPKPFRFDDRERIRKTKKSIRQRKLEEMLREKEEKQAELIHYKFKANPIPSTTTKPLYEQMMKAQEQHSREVKEQSKAMTKAREKPFSFYERDKDFYVRRARATEQHIPETMRNVKPFKATPIPAAVSAQFLDEMQRQAEEERKERVQQWAQELMAESRLPPRMALHEQEKQQTQKVPHPLPYSFEPPRAHPVPDFKRQQDIFQKTLEKHKQQKRPTVLQPFHFRESKTKANIREFMDQENLPKVEIKPMLHPERIASLAKPSINPPTTAKIMQAMEFKRKLLVERRQREEQKLVEAKARKDKLKALAPEVRAIIKDNKEQLKKQTEEKLRLAKQQFRQQELEWQAKRQEIAQTVKQRPLLMQQPVKPPPEEREEGGTDDRGEVKEVDEDLEEGEEGQETPNGGQEDQVEDQREDQQEDQREDRQEDQREDQGEDQVEDQGETRDLQEDQEEQEEQQVVDDERQELRRQLENRGATDEQNDMEAQEDPEEQQNFGEPDDQDELEEDVQETHSV